MADIRQLLAQVAAREAQGRQVAFLAPCVRGGKVQTRIAGVVQTFTVTPDDFGGWGVFAPLDTKTARLIEEASLAQVTEYLALFPALRVRLVQRLGGTRWLSYPTSESDMAQRFGKAQPLVVQGVTEGGEFEAVVVRRLSGVWWFEGVDYRADPIPADTLRAARTEGVAPEQLRFPNLTPEMRTVYALAVEADKALAAFVAEKRLSAEERRLRHALQTGGGSLCQFRDSGDFWLVDWRTSKGDLHTSAIAKGDLTVVSSGICLSGEDRKFDLTSLVKVIEKQEDAW